MFRWFWLGILGLLMLAAPAEAASGTGFVVSPAFQEVGIKKDQPVVEYALQITNRNGVDQNFRLSGVDFEALGENGGVAFLGQPTSELEHKYGLASWMKLDRESVVVPAGQSVQLKVTIENRASLAAGGHYGAVLATAVTDGGQAVKDGVGVKQVLSSLVLLTKEGAGAPELKLTGQTTNGNWWRLPTVLEQRFQNSGGLHTAPRGVVEMRDPSGRLVARGALNEGSGLILPESFRYYKTALMPMAKAWMPGRYEIVTHYRPDGSEQTKQFRVSLWYAGPVFVWVLLVLVLGAVGVLAWWLFGRVRRR